MSINLNTIYIVLNYISIAIMFACFVIINTQSASHMQKLAMLIIAMIIFCSIGFIIRSETKDVSAYIAGQKICYVFVTHAMFLIILFVLEYCKYSIPTWIKWLFHSINFLITFVALTMDYHKLFYKSYWAILENGVLVVSKEYGFMHTLAVGLFLFYMAVFIGITVVFSIKNFKKRKNYVWRLLIAIMIPCLTYLIPKLTGSDIVFQNIAFAVFSVMLLYMIYKNNLYDVENIAAHMSIESMDEAFIVFDQGYLFTGCNKPAQKMFPILKNLELDIDIRQYETPLTDFLDGKVEEYRVDEKIYRVSVKSIAEGNITRGKVVRLEDVTVARNYTNLLEENKARVDKDLEMAKSIQMAALPSAKGVFSAIPQIDVASFMVTAREVGGDFYDLYMLGEKHAAFLIADVSGKGIPAAMFMMQAKATIRNYIDEGLPVQDAFSQANERLCEGNDANMFVTAWMGILDLSTGRISFANAGHNAPVLIRKGEKAEYLQSRPDMVLGGMEGIRYKLQELQLNPGDRLYLYTDGVTEATDLHNELYGEERLIQFFRKNVDVSVENMLPAVKEDIDRFVGEAEQFDDITMVMLELRSKMDV